MSFNHALCGLYATGLGWARFEADETEELQDQCATTVSAPERTLERSAVATRGGEPEQLREQFVLLFGMNQAWNPNQKELTVQLSDRIVMSPFAAKRLALLLNNVLREYEAKHGTLDIENRTTTSVS